jgi:hypothetical protein
MARWTGEIITMRVGGKWAYKVRLLEQIEVDPRSELVLSKRLFATEEEARAAGEAHLQSEIEKRSA